MLLQKGRRKDMDGQNINLRETALLQLNDALSAGEAKVSELIRICQMEKQSAPQIIPSGWRIESDEEFCSKKR
jgi:hypothetical protein